MNCELFSVYGVLQSVLVSVEFSVALNHYLRGPKWKQQPSMAGRAWPGPGS